MLAFRTFSADMANLVLNHPTVRPTLEGTEPLDATYAIADADNVFIAGEFALAHFIQEEPGRYAGHIAVIEDRRGRSALLFGKAALAKLFGTYEARSVRAAVPEKLRGARAYVRMLGFTSNGVDPVRKMEDFMMEAGDVRF